MSNSSSHPNNNNDQSSKDLSQSSRGSSFLASLLPISSSFTTQPTPRHNSLSSSAGSSAMSESVSSLATSTDRVPLTGSPISSIASPGAAKPGPMDYSNPYFPYGSPNSGQPRLSGSFSSLASSFRWPSSAGASSVQPIAIPNSDSGAHINNPDTTSALTGSSAPTRRASVGTPSFRRAFELPNYSNLYTLNDQDHPQAPSAPVDASRRGRSGSLFSSFGTGDASKRATGPPRRKLSPMGERMIRDHPF